MWNKLEYFYDKNGSIIFPPGSPFDGEPVLVKTNIGIVEAWWQKWEHTPNLEDPYDGDGFCWVCYDDMFQLELDEVLMWMPIPEETSEAKKQEEAQIEAWREALSEQLYDEYMAVIKRNKKSTKLLERVRDACLFDDDDGIIGVSTEDIPPNLFNAICKFLNSVKQ